MDIHRTKILLWIGAIIIVVAYLVSPNKLVPGKSTYEVKGYYAPYTKTLRYDGEYFGTTTCDAFVESQNSNPLVQKLKDLVLQGNTVNSITTQGNLKMNIDLAGLDQDLQNKIKQSSPKSPVMLNMKERVYTDGKEVIGCGTFVDIIEGK